MTSPIPEPGRVDDCEHEQQGECAGGPEQPPRGCTGIGPELDGGEHQCGRYDDPVRQEVPLEVGDGEGDKHAAEESRLRRRERRVEARNREHAHERSEGDCAELQSSRAVRDIRSQRLFESKTCAGCESEDRRLAGRELEDEARSAACGPEPPRREPSRHLDRLQSFRMREYVCIGSPEDVSDFRERWMVRAQAIARDLGLTFKVDYASDPFFGRVGQMKAVSQKQQSLKFELLIPLRSEDSRPPA